MFQTGDVKFNALTKELQLQLENLSEGKTIYAVRIAELEDRVQVLENALGAKRVAKLFQPPTTES